MIKRYWQKIKAHQARRKQRRFEYWARVRKGGQARFIIRGTMLYSMLYLTMHEFGHAEVGLFTIVTAHLTGLLIAYTGWGVGENDYKRALNTGKYQPQI